MCLAFCCCCCCYVVVVVVVMFLPTFFFYRFYTGGRGENLSFLLKKQVKYFILVYRGKTVLKKWIIAQKWMNQECICICSKLSLKNVRKALAK